MNINFHTAGVSHCNGLTRKGVGGGGLIPQTSLVFPSLTLHFSTSLSLPSYTDQAGNSISIVAFYKVTLRVLYAFGNPVASCYRAADDAE